MQKNLIPKDADIKQLFRNRLKHLMDQQDINQSELAKILGVSESTVGKWILMKSIPRMGIIQKLADFFHTEKSYFLEKDIDKSKETVSFDLSISMPDDSLQGARLHKNDTVFLRRQNSLLNSCIMVVQLDGIIFIRRTYSCKEYIILTAENPTYPPILIPDSECESRLKIIGLAIAFQSPIQ